MKTKFLLGLLAVSLAFNLSVIVTFGHHWMMRKYFDKGPDVPMFFNHKFKKMLDLTDKQAAFMENDRVEMRKTMEPLRNEMQKKREELFALVDADAVDNAKVDGLIGDISLIQAKIEKAVVNHSLLLRKEMTPEQDKKFRDFLKKHFKKNDDEKGPRHGGRPF